MYLQNHKFMAGRKALSRYHLIINKLQKHCATLDEILDHLERQGEIHGDDFSISKRTFQRDVEAIWDLYKMEIKYDPSAKIYYIEDHGETELNTRMLEAFDVFNALNLSDGLKRYIYFDKRKPKGTEHLYILLHAIKNRQTVLFDYQKYEDPGASRRHAQPYALKEAKNQWYLLGKEINDETVKSFALDRMSNPEATKKKFRYPEDYNVEEQFRDFFGIDRYCEEPAAEVELSFAPYQGHYIKALPLHESQEVIVDTCDELRIHLKLHITYDFIMELLAYGKELQVLKPAGLRKAIIHTLEESLKQYKKRK